MSELEEHAGCGEDDAHIMLAQILCDNGSNGNTTKHGDVGFCIFRPRAAFTILRFGSLADHFQRGDSVDTFQRREA